MADDDAVVEPAVPAKKSKKKGKKAAKKKANGAPGRSRGPVKFPKHSILDCIRIPQAIVDQNAGEACTDREGAAFAKIGWTGDIKVEISSASKYKLLERPSPGKIKPTELPIGLRDVNPPQRHGAVTPCRQRNHTLKLLVWCVPEFAIHSRRFSAVVHRYPAHSK